MSKMKKDEKNIPESFALDKSKLRDAIKKPLKAVLDGFAHAGAAAAGHAMPKPVQEKPKQQIQAPVKKVDPKTRLPGTLMEKGDMKSLVDKSKTLATALEHNSMKKNDQEWVNKMAKCMSLKKDDAKSTATPPPVNTDAAKQITNSFNGATGTSGIMQGIKNVGSALGFGKTELEKKHIGWDKLHSKLENEGYSKNSADKIAGSIKAKVGKAEEDKPKEEKPKEKPVDAMDIIAHPRSVKKGGDIMEINSEPALHRAEGAIPRPTNWTPNHLKKLKNHMSVSIMGGPIAATTQASTGTTPGAGGLAQSEKSHLQKDGASPPPPNPGAQSAQDSMRQAFHFGKAEPMKKDGGTITGGQSSLAQGIKNTAQSGGNKPINMPNPFGKSDSMKKCNDPAFLKQLHGSLKLKKMYGVEMAEKTEESKPHDSSQGGPTQDEPHANMMNKEKVEKHYDDKLRGVHQSMTPEKGTAWQRAATEDQSKQLSPGARRLTHKENLKELKEQPKPNLPKTEKSEANDKPHNSSKGGPTQDEAHANEMNMKKDEQHIKGVHQQGAIAGHNMTPGKSLMGDAARKGHSWAKQDSREHLKQLKSMLKPNLPKTEKAEALSKPYVSQAQAGFFHTNPQKVGGKAVVKEWDQATKGKHLPKTVKSESEDKIKIPEDSTHKAHWDLAQKHSLVKPNEKPSDYTYTALKAKVAHVKK